MSTLAISGWDKPAVTIQKTATEAKAMALEQSRAISEVKNDLEAQLASETLRDLKSLINSCESARTEVKAPVLDLGKRIDAAAKEYSQDLQSELSRVSRLVSGYQAEKHRAAEEARRKQQEELARIERERLEAEEKARREAEAAIAVAASPKAVAAAEVAAESAIIEATFRAEEKLAAVVPVEQPQKLEGVSVRKVWLFEVNDIRSLYAARPDLVELSPKNRDIKAALEAGAKLPGIKAWQENSARIRA